MRLFEIAFITLILLTILVRLIPPMPEDTSYAQRWVLVNDLYIDMFRQFGSDMYAPSNNNVQEYLRNTSYDLGLCIYYQVGLSSFSTCNYNPNDAVFLKRHVLERTIILGIGI